MRSLWLALAGRRRPFVLIVGLEALAGGSEALLHPLLLKALFDEAILVKDFQRFLTLGILYLALGLTLNTASYWVSSWRKRYENESVSALEMELLDRTLELDGKKLSKAGNASYASRIHNDVYQGLLPSIDITIQVARQGIASVVFVGVLLYLSWKASLILLVVVPPLVALSNRLAKRIADNTEPEREAEAQYINNLTRTLEAFHGIQGMKNLHPGTKRTNRTMLGSFLDITYVNYIIGLRQRTVSDVVMNISDTVSMVVGAYFVFAGQLTFGGFLAFVNSLWRAVTGIFFVINAIPQFRRNTAVLERIDALRTSSTPAYYRSGPLLQVSDAQVTYYEGAPVTPGDIALDAGERVVLRGPNGSGKTTLLHIISGTLKPDGGTVILPERVASLTAPVLLPPLTVREMVPDDVLRSQLDVAHLDDQTPATLSSGQRQRVGVAALLCEDADLYVIDEPFANLDDLSRQLVLDALLQYTASRSLLVVLHGDQSLDNHFDRVITLAAPTPQAVRNGTQDVSATSQSQVMITYRGTMPPR